MSGEENKNAVLRLYEEGINRQNYDVIDELLSPDFVSHESTPIDFGTGPDSLKRRISLYKKGFTDHHVDVGEQIAEGDMVVTRWTTRGTHTGDLPGMPATGKYVELPGVTISKFSEGKIVEEWVFYDRQKLLMDLGLASQMEVVAVCSDEKWDVGWF